MQIIRGIGVSQGVAVGPALVLDTQGLRIPQQKVKPEQVPAEWNRLQAALREVVKEAALAQEDVTRRLGAQYGAIFASHALLLEDPLLIEELQKLIQVDRYTAEYAVTRAIRGFIEKLKALGENSFLAWRASDLHDIERRILDQLIGERGDPLMNLAEPVIIAAHDLTPSETASLDRSKVYAIATEHGGKTSHTAILANALEIPAVVGLGPFINQISGGDTLIVDGIDGTMILNPDPATLYRYRRIRDSRLSKTGHWVVGLQRPVSTRDGVHIRLLGNIEFPEEASSCVARGAEGIGLYRTEFLYAGRSCDPTEEEHYRAYTRVLREVGSDRPVVIRTLDLGADKFASAHAVFAPEKNPSLGVRSVRVCLRDTGLFRKQLRAILRASAHGNVRIMFPMVSTTTELTACRGLLEDVKEDLHDEGIAFNANIPVGTMIEVPSAALMADRLAQMVDFFSIGTNDLIQYTLAADRTNEHVADLYNPADPAVLRLIQRVVHAAEDRGISVNVCGEMSGDPLFTPLLVGLGLRQLSLTANNLADVRAVVSRLDLPTAQRIAQTALELDSAREIVSFLRAEMKRIYPDVFGKLGDE